MVVVYAVPSTRSQAVLCENNYSVYGCNFVKTVNIIDHKVGNWMIGMPGSAVWPGNARSSSPAGPAGNWTVQPLSPSSLLTPQC